MNDHEQQNPPCPVCGNPDAYWQTIQETRREYACERCHLGLPELPTLTLNLKAEYFDQIAAGTKEEEYREAGKYWSRRLLIPGTAIARTFSKIVLCKGYPKQDDPERRIVRPWRGVTLQKITHPHFGKDPVWVFAIKVN